MQRVSFTGLANSHATITGRLLAIFSRQPVTFTLYASEITGTECRLTVRNTRTGESFAEERTAVRETSNTFGCEFEIARMLQLVCPTDDILKRVTYDGVSVSLADNVQLTFSVKNAGTWQNYANLVVECLHASCDWGESINSATVLRRMWLNFPQTFTAGRDTGEEYIEVTGEGTYEAYPDSEALADCAYELDALTFLSEQGDAIVETLEGGAEGEIILGYNGIIANGQGTKTYSDKVYRLKPELCAYGRGVYLRWLDRFGAVGYWLFDKSKHAVVTSLAQSYERTPSGVPAMPQAGVIDSASRQSFAVAEQITIGTANLTESEYNYLLTLAQSPCVEMLVDGSDRNDPVWARVAVLPATYTREIPRSELPRVREFEIIIVPPQRNSARL